MSATLLSLLTFVAVVLGVAGIYSILADLYLRDRSRANSRVDDEFRRKQRGRAERSTLFRNLNQFAAEVEAGRIDRATIAQRFETMIEQSGLETTPRKVLTISAVVGLVLGGLCGGLLRSPLWGAAGLVVGVVLPVLYVRRVKAAREEKLRSQLPDAFDLMSRVVRAGQTMAQALLAVADEFSPPIAAEFSYCYEQQNLGLPPDVAYNDLAKRNDLVEIKLFVLALLVQQQTGGNLAGNLAELLDKLSGVLRERFRIRGVVQTLTAEGRMQAWILMGLPPAIFAMIMVMNPPYAMQLFLFPKLIYLTLASEALGALWIRKIVNFQY
jgi:tight adherence protein B